MHKAYVIQTTTLKPLYNSLENYWLHGAECFAGKINIGALQDWSKNLIKQNTYNFWLNSVQEQLCNRPILKYMHDLILPYTEKIESQDILLDWWWRAKMGSILLSVLIVYCVNVLQVKH